MKDREEEDQLRSKEDIVKIGKAARFILTTGVAIVVYVALAIIVVVSLAVYALWNFVVG